MKMQCRCTHQVSVLTVSWLGSRSQPLYAFVSTVTSSKELCITYLFADYIKHCIPRFPMAAPDHLLVNKCFGNGAFKKAIIRHLQCADFIISLVF